MSDTYTGSISVDGILTWFYVETTHDLARIVIESDTTATAEWDGTNEVITVTLDNTVDYTDAGIQELIENATLDGVTSVTVTGMNYERASADWTGTVYMIVWLDALWGQGTQLYRKGDDNEWQRIVKIQNISGPSFGLDTEDTTDMDSPGGWEEIVPTVLRSGELNMDVAFIPSAENHKELLYDMQNKVRRDFKLVFPDADLTTFSFAGYVIDWDTDIPYDSTVDASVTIKPTGAPDLNAVAPQHEE